MEKEEVTILWANENATPNGTEFIEFTIICRAGRKSVKLWMDYNINFYNKRQLKLFANKFGVDMSKTYQDLSEFLRAFEEKTASCCVKIQSKGHYENVYLNF